MLPVVSKPEAEAILGAMLAVAARRGAVAPTDSDQASIAAAGRYMFRLQEPVDFQRLTMPSPSTLAARLTDRETAAHALRLIAVMALVDGALDEAKIDLVADYARALGIEEAYLTELTEAAHGHLRWALADMTRKNMESITGQPWADGDVFAWLLPYRGAGADPGLAARYKALEHLPAGSFGRAFWKFYRANGYLFPGESDALNAVFATPHDSTHIMSGYDTTAGGEILVSTFTAAMHARYPMAGHVLPVIFSWHLGIKINDVAKSTTGTLDPSRFWEAWARGAEMKVDLFDAGWDFWAWTGESLGELRRRYGVVPREG